MNKLKIALFGYGKMGKEIEKIAIQRNHEIVLKIDIDNAKSITSEQLSNADVAIDFSIPSGAYDNIIRCFDANLPIVVGTTGWLDKLSEIKKICETKNQAFFYASNFSIGVNLFFEVNKYLAKLMNNYNEYDISLDEIHHIHKLDKPSGTAISLANDIINNIDRKVKWTLENRNKNEELFINSIREGEVPGTHIVKYQSAVDDVEIMHKAKNRKGFALGAVLAAEWLHGKKGVFNMKDLLNI